MMMISEPEPTEVTPTMTPPMMPISSVGTGLTTNGIMLSPGLRRAPSSGFTISPVTTTSSGDAERHLHLALQRRARPELAQHQHAQERGRDRPEHQPPDQRLLHGAALPVDRAADRLHDHRRDDVARHRGQRLDAEQQHQDRRHQRPAAHAGQADDEADAEAAQDDEGVEHSQHLNTQSRVLQS